MRIYRPAYFFIRNMVNVLQRCGCFVVDHEKTSFPHDLFIYEYIKTGMTRSLFVFMHKKRKKPRVPCTFLPEMMKGSPGLFIYTLSVKNGSVTIKEGTDKYRTEGEQN